MEPKRENSEALSVMELMVRLHLDNPRQGPGSEEMAKLLFVWQRFHLKNPIG